MHQALTVQSLWRDRFPLCLHSAGATNFAPARFSFLPDSPQLRLWRDKDGNSWRDGQPCESFERGLDDLVEERRIAGGGRPEPFLGGWVIYYGFENYHSMRGLATPGASKGGGDLPMACLWRVDKLLIHDHESGQWSHCINRERTQIDGKEIGLGQEGKAAATGEGEPVQLARIDEDEESHFFEGCEEIIEAVHRGDVIQVNLARRWLLEFAHAIDAGAVAQALAQGNPSAFFCVFPLAEETVVSASPERLFSIRGGFVETRPLGGTVERDLADAARDARLRQSLRSDAKLASEHLMLVDLERNDISRVCLNNTVRVEALAVIESHPALHHLLSIISGRLRPDARLSEVFGAMCPGGSISGCPKQMCLKILSRLEPRPRQWFSGAFGYIDDSGDCDINLLIRSMALRGKHAYLFAGAGIVADSEPRAELAETRLKARALLEALALATNNPPEALRGQP